MVRNAFAEFTRILARILAFLLSIVAGTLIVVVNAPLLGLTWIVDQLDDIGGADVRAPSSSSEIMNMATMVTAPTAEDYSLWFNPETRVMHARVGGEWKPCDSLGDAVRAVLKDREGKS